MAAFKPGPDAERIRESATRRGILLYHYTAVESLPSILTSGAILSRAQMDAKGIAYDGHGWGKKGKDKELGDYICCSFRPHWGMLRRETAPQAVIQLDPALLWRAGTVFCPGNSASNEYDLDFLKARNTLEAFDTMFGNQFTRVPTNYQSEALVHRDISLQHIQLIHVLRTEHQDETIRLLNKVPIGHLSDEVTQVFPITVAVTPRLFP